MTKPRRKPALIGAMGLMCLALSGAPALAQGADAAQPQEPDRRRALQQQRQQKEQQRQQQQVQPQQPRERDGNRPNWRDGNRNAEDRNRWQDRNRDDQQGRERRNAEDRNRMEQQWRERRAADERARSEQQARERQAAEERARSEQQSRERRLVEERRRDGDRRWDRNNDGRRDFGGRDRDRDGIPNYRDRDRDGDGVPNYRDRNPDSARWSDRRWLGPSHGSIHRRHVWVNHHRFDVRPDRRRVYRNVVILRPYGPWYVGYGRYYRDEEAYRWLGLTAFTLGILNYLDEAQLRAHEDAQIAATSAAIGVPMAWHLGPAHGSVVATREGWTDTGIYCREFQQTVQIGGQLEQAYGTACMQPDGSWQVTS